MMFSTKAEYGVRVMVELARRADGAGGNPISLAEIAEHDGLPLAYLEHLVARLRKAGLVDSRRGSRGGYLLARPAGEITMAEVVEALEGSIAPIECISQASDGSIVCSRESGRAGSHPHICPTKLLWTRVRGAIVRTLRDTTLADLVLEPGGKPLPADLALPADAAWIDAPLPPSPQLSQPHPSPAPQPQPQPLAQSLTTGV
jgi:Rrf2 family transcriptional regulator, cysteine metabolism repressor